MTPPTGKKAHTCAQAAEGAMQSNAAPAGIIAAFRESCHSNRMQSIRLQVQRARMNMLDLSTGGRRSQPIAS
jgi:hypothetical protein